MKLSTLSLFLVGGAILLGSCSSGEQTANKSQLYNNATAVDSEGFDFLKTVHEKAVSEVERANYAVSVSTSSAVRELAAKVVDTYESIIPDLVDIATDAHVVLPDPGAFVWSPEASEADSLAGFDDQEYIAHVQREQKLILEQFKRADRNTYKVLNRYAAEQLPAIQELYILAGGEEDHGAHH